MLRSLLAVALLAITIPVQAQSLKIPTAAYAAAIAADKATTLNCTLRVGCSEAMPGYAWLDRKGGPAAQMAVSTTIDVASVIVWRKLVGPKHPRIAAAGLYGMAAIRGFVAARNYSRVSRSY